MKNIAFLFFLLVAQNCFGQLLNADAVRQHAFGFNRLDTIDPLMVDVFRSQRLVLVGEMHGTSEPAKFVEFIAKNLFGKGRKICVGFEISPQDMPPKEELYDSAALADSPFFMEQFSGKDSKAWFDLVRNVSQLTDVEIFYFDLTKKQIKQNASQVDSMMFLNIKEKMMADTNAIYICLTGNYHNRLNDRNFPVPMGHYFLSDKQLHLNLSNMVSFNHVYVEGAANFNTGDGLRLHNLKNSDYMYTLTGRRNYFSFTHDMIDSNYNGVLFTYHVSASFGLH